MCPSHPGLYALQKQGTAKIAGVTQKMSLRAIDTIMVRAQIVARGCGQDESLASKKHTEGSFFSRFLLGIDLSIQSSIFSAF